MRFELDHDFERMIPALLGSTESENTRLAGPGTRLGLTLADTIARALRGSLLLAPRVSGGITATFALPAKKDPVSTPGVESTSD